MADRILLLGEDKPDDEMLPFYALKNHSVCNTVRVTRDRAEALDILSGTTIHADRDMNVQPALVVPRSLFWMMFDESAPRRGGL
jgi:hypothetical protein